MKVSRSMKLGTAALMVFAVQAVFAYNAPVLEQEIGPGPPDVDHRPSMQNLFDRGELVTRKDPYKYLDETDGDYKPPIENAYPPPKKDVVSGELSARLDPYKSNGLIPNGLGAHNGRDLNGVQGNGFLVVNGLGAHNGRDLNGVMGNGFLTHNGLSSNGWLVHNGLSSNGFIVMNGLGSNGFLVVNGLGSNGSFVPEREGRCDDRPDDSCAKSYQFRFDGLSTKPLGK